MTGVQLYEALGEVNGEYVRQAREGVKAKRPPRRGWAAAAACLCAAAALAAWGLRPVGNLVDTYTTAIVSGYPGNTGSQYTVPRPGEYFCSVDVQEAREHYAGKDVVFVLAFELFKDGSVQPGVTEEERRAEYRRLAELGFTLCEAEAWTYRGEGEREYYTVVVGAFTEEQLAGFPVSPEYGYHFHFVYNGDHSSLDGDQLITAFETNYAC